MNKKTTASLLIFLSILWIPIRPTKAHALSPAVFSLSVSSPITIAPSIRIAQSGGASGVGQAVGSAINSPGGQLIAGLLSSLFSGNFNLGSLLGGLIGPLGNLLGISPQIIGVLNTALGAITGGGISPGGVVGAIGSLAGLSPQQIQTAQQVAGILPGIISAISSGNLQGVLSGINGILGLLNPQAVQNTIGSSSGGLTLPSGGGTVNPIQDAKDPAEVRTAAKLAETYKRDQLYKASGIVLYDEGQERIKANLETASSGLQQAGKISDEIISWDKVQVEAAQQSLKGADFSIEVANQAIKDKSTQDVIKKVAILQAAGNIQSGLAAGQLTYMSRNLAGISSQSTASIGQQRIANESLAVLEILGANSLQQQNDIANLVNTSNTREEANDTMTEIAGAVSMVNIYVPGYLPSGQGFTQGGYLIP